MTSVNNNSNVDINMYLNLAPPGSEGDPYSNLAVNMQGVPIGQNADPGQAVANLLGYSNKDTLGSALDEIIALARQLNSAFISNEQGTSQEALQHFLNNLDPTSPELPPFKAFIDLAERLLASGYIGGIQIQASNDTNQAQLQNTQQGFDNYNESVNQQNQDPSNPNPTQTNANQAGSQTGNSTQTPADNQSAATRRASNPYSQAGADEAQQIKDQKALSDSIKTSIDQGVNDVNSRTSTVSYAKTHGGNPWLAGNVYVAFLESFTEMQRMLMRNKEVEGNIQVQSMKLVVTLAQDTAQVIMDVAKENQMMHIASAVMAGVSIGVSVGGMAYGSAGNKLGSEGFNLQKFDRGAAISGLGGAISQLGTSVSQAATDLQIAAGQGREEILRAYQQIAQSQMNKAGDEFKADTDTITQLFQALDQIRQNLQQAVQASLSAR